MAKHMVKPRRWQRVWKPYDFRRKGIWFVTVYETDECYGGPEEGGWWYEAGTPIKSIRVKGHAAALGLADAITDRSERAMTNPSFDHEVFGPNDNDGTEMYESKIKAYVARTPGVAYPDSRPRYE